MNETFRQILNFINNNEIKISAHGYDELAEDGILVKDILKGVKNGILVEDYPDYPKGHCMLILQKDSEGNPLHVVWGIPKGKDFPAVLITAYRPAAENWNNDFTRRIK